MKEYWVNVYEDDFGRNDGKHSFGWIYSNQKYLTEEKFSESVKIYSLHVREFDTREAKELYLKMKYGKFIYDGVEVRSMIK